MQEFVLPPGPGALASHSIVPPVAFPRVSIPDRSLVEKKRNSWAAAEQKHIALRVGTELVRSWQRLYCWPGEVAILLYLLGDLYNSGQGSTRTSTVKVKGCPRVDTLTVGSSFSVFTDTYFRLHISPVPTGNAHLYKLEPRVRDGALHNCGILERWKKYSQGQLHWQLFIVSAFAHASAHVSHYFLVPPSINATSQIFEGRRVSFQQAVQKYVE